MTVLLIIAQLLPGFVISGCLFYLVHANSQLRKFQDQQADRINTANAAPPNDGQYFLSLPPLPLPAREGQQQFECLVDEGYGFWHIVPIIERSEERFGRWNWK